MGRAGGLSDAGVELILWEATRNGTRFGASSPLAKLPLLVACACGRRYFRAKAASHKILQQFPIAGAGRIAPCSRP